MIKAIISTVAVFIILICGAVTEQILIAKEFDYIRGEVVAVKNLVEEKTVKNTDMDALIDMWHGKKSWLQNFIPHNDVRDIDPNLALCKSYIATGEYNMALARLQFIIEIFTALPKSYKISIENIF